MSYLQKYTVLTARHPEFFIPAHQLPRLTRICRFIRIFTLSLIILLKRVYSSKKLVKKGKASQIHIYLIMLYTIINRNQKDLNTKQIRYKYTYNCTEYYYTYIL